MLDLAIKEKNTQLLCCSDKECKKKNPQTLKLEPRKFNEIDIKKITQEQAKLKAIAEIQAQEWLAQQPNAKHCPTPECSWAFINDAKPPFITHCPQCQAYYCSECLVNHDRKTSCQNAKQDTATEKWKKQNTKRCPQCNVAIEKNEGCLHMTCKKCNHEFCWQCMRPYAEKGHGPYNCSLKPIRNPQARVEESDESDDYSIDALMRSLPEGLIPPRPIAMDETIRREERRLLEALTQINELERHVRDIRGEPEIRLRNLIIDKAPAKIAALNEGIVNDYWSWSGANLRAMIERREEPERLEQNLGGPVQTPRAFISDRPEHFIRTNNLPQPAYIIEFTQRNNPDFVWNFLNSIRHRFLPIELVFSVPYMDGVETIVIQNTTRTREQVQRIIDEANAHFARQQQQYRQVHFPE